MPNGKATSKSGCGYPDERPEFNPAIIRLSVPDLVLDNDDRVKAPTDNLDRTGAWTVPLETLRLRLVEAMSSFRATNDQEGRLAAVTASLAGVIEFLNSDSKLCGVRSPLIELQDNLLDVAKGINAPLFAPVPRRGRPPSSEATLYVRALALLSVKALVRAGESVSAACDFTARAFTKAGCRAEGGNEIKRDTVKKWKSEGSGIGGISIVRQRVNAATAQYAAQGGWPRDIKAAKAICELNAMVAARPL
ncbi:hypothetical protein sos41_14040 [Alphaproteobacteria bacterium SO-S41]|nr:hypothetical protein sos41_14040 [Alphaproteobacteria bacterium SO-S41]